MKSILLGSFLAALALFFWGFFFYSVSGVPDRALKSPTTDVGPMLNEAFPESGTYFVPGMATSEETVALMARGPIAMVHMHREGIAAMSPVLMIAGFLHGWGYCLLAAWLLTQICKKSGYSTRVGFVTLIGFVGAFYARIGDAIWWHKSIHWQLTELFYMTAGSLIAGLVLAKFIKSPIQS
ncbi:hypothetical protein [Synoicihabitans lomoniglobus]|uniref:Uncharacterized protein n=1 Tax=Synoicihabitans lomoniglobus TaxID=2909285 RepID=A0AAF0CP44_9BACT|nr:hypothetical protein [Opitutaceae bacterium LMO-M01]WED65571.1 hypothetical protein PXH66_01740 [Opitutaceae bacterium LMO-M01]